ncbi:hypothetical protein [Haloferula sp.]|uniref:hypothetical protein n=1 Tax=Haloferula sp. TaxID=2497595 RepID=UPI003C71F7C9
MKFLAYYLCLAAWLLPPSKVSAQNLNWGSVIYSDLVDSEGQVLDQTYVFQMGAFVGGFVPDETNTSDWLSNWQVFDAADYNGLEDPDDGIFGYFTSSAGMMDDGLSDSPDQSSLASSFEGLDAYLWIRNSDLDAPGSEWFLGRAGDWIFPMAVPGCCDNDGVLEWSTSDLLAGDVPVWGSQGGTVGNGEYSVNGSDTLQTFTFVPEPSTAMFVVMFGTLMILRRRRSE